MKNLFIVVFAMLISMPSFSQQFEKEKIEDQEFNN